MRKLLITGASGFLGQPIVKSLADAGEYDIYAVSINGESVAFPDCVHSVTTDLLDGEQSKRVIDEVRPEIMIHLAWGLSGPDFLRSAQNIVWLEESLRILRAFVESGGKYIAFAGSSSEYEQDSGCLENGDISDLTMYGRCKSTFHKIAEQLCRENGISYVNLRFFPTIGKGMRANTAIIMAVTAFIEGEKFICKAPHNVWDFIGISDASRAVRAIIGQQYSGVVNIGSGVPRVMGEVFKTIAQKMNSEHLLDLKQENNSKTILVANTDVLNKTIGFTCAAMFDDMLDEVIFSVRERG